MPTPAEVTEAHYAAQARQGAAAALLARRLWDTVDVDELDRSWAKIVGRLTVTVGSAQLGAAKAGAAYVPLALAAVGADPATGGEVVPNRWAMVASDGRPLDSLLFSSVVRVREAFGAGRPAAQALEAGGRWLDALVRTQVADAGRGAAGAAIAARENVGWVRMVSPPCCQRCAVLAGKFFRWNDGFRRHPRCDCRHVPHAGGRPTGYTADIGPDQIHDLTAEQRRAIADGANTNQVINAHRRRSGDGLTTSEGATRRGVYGGYERRADGSLRRRQKGEKIPARLTPEAIYRMPVTREEAVRLLHTYGYLA